ncbi:hypothetical protein BK133_05290 [Paenibacillus sp. FSL H8-0548]|uniref:helix-turn-helix domain-containing protein n=1 Tax=Paenibacillus sp. FSL H8-0548 TaxID=1920422 RepID=UPI00096DF8E4|nr:helix-turn-helix transcriptional regulator [Paenibacillus sp. FSL H8-0548]OMF37472.1 hypothetical protein BK133_05290 [Paenibacillus sp. FSL H8-0548]
MIFQERLKKLRNAKGITQEQLATALDIPSASIRRLETVNSLPRRERLDKIADYFNVSIDYLTGRTDIQEVTPNSVPQSDTSKPMPEQDYHFFDTEGVQFIARSKKNLSPQAYQKMQELAKKAKELFEDDDED